LLPTRMLYYSWISGPERRSNNQTHHNISYFPHPTITEKLIILTWILLAEPHVVSLSCLPT
jgi:hypothetical protein